MQMWSLLKTYNTNSAGIERPVNHLNEWGGYSRKLDMPVFTGWRDLTKYDKRSKTTTALVLDSNWSSAVGVNNQEKWLAFAEQKSAGVAAFFVVHAADENAEPRQVKYIDDDRVFIGKIIRKGTETYIVGQPRIL